MRLNKPKIDSKWVAGAICLAVFLANLFTPLFVMAFYDLNQDVQEMQKSINKDKPKAKPHKIVSVVITAYTSSAEETDSEPFIAASGKKVYDGMLAANWLPFGTKIKIPSLYGDKVFTVDDRMNPRYGYGRMDMWLDASQVEAKKFGAKRVKVEIYYLEKKLAENR